MGEEDNPDDEEPRLESWREPLLERPPNWREVLLCRDLQTVSYGWGFDTEAIETVCIFTFYLLGRPPS